MVEYVGEVITNEEAEERGKKYGMFYNYYANYSTMVFLYFFRKVSNKLYILTLVRVRGLRDSFVF